MSSSIIVVFFLLLFCLDQTYTYETKLEWPKPRSADIISPRIVGGKEAAPHAFPYQAALHIRISGSQSSAFCGGSIISDQHILTAAHCLISAEEVTVVLGAHNLSAIEATQQRYYSTNFIIHKKYEETYLQNDIALVVLPNKVEFSFAVQPILLPKKSDRYRFLIFSTATVSGWGKSKDLSFDISPVLRYVRAKIVPLVICMALYHYIGFNQICLEGLFGRSPCGGDSGGPLVLNQNGENVQHGITSYTSIFGCEVGFPSGFTKVSSFINWIESNTGILIRN